MSRFELHPSALSFEVVSKKAKIQQRKLRREQSRDNPPLTTNFLNLLMNPCAKYGCEVDLDGLGGDSHNSIDVVNVNRNSRNTHNPSDLSSLTFEGRSSSISTTNSDPFQKIFKQDYADLQTFSACSSTFSTPFSTPTPKNPQHHLNPNILDESSSTQSTESPSPDIKTVYRSANPPPKKVEYSFFEKLLRDINSNVNCSSSSSMNKKQGVCGMKQRAFGSSLSHI
ncbi:hypothetical protein TrLO_g11682 [Triparma laevis f. longispina]|uniref:Uncharacterized protein n=1 Tax=Triparma laevis f. longispina TaxID=1714387 RepID=A0A9W7BYY2_9STRA|nr:hypothetical protein TrLO_g11682 [Triparma laevis f. longispina]